jgi:nicotinamidase-related amidase
MTFLPDEKGRLAGFTPLPNSHLLVGRPALLVIDMQHDFVDADGPCYNIGAEHTIEPMLGLIELFRQRELPVIFTREAHRPDRADAGLEADPNYHTPPHTIEGTRGYAIVDALVPRESEFVIDKRRYSCFLGTELDLILRSLEVQTLVVCGVSSDVCVHWTAGEAFQRDFHVRVVEDCTAGLSLADHAASLLVLRNLCSGGRAVFAADIAAALATAFSRAP